MDAQSDINVEFPLFSAVLGVSPQSGKGSGGPVLETTRSGQLRLAAPSERRPYPTGLQVPCAACAEAGVYRLGLPRAGKGSPALCVPCWRGRRERQDRTDRRRDVAEAWDQAAEVDAAIRCEVCDSVDPEPGCWLCGHAWLAAARAEHEREEAARAAAETAQLARIQACTEAEARVEYLTSWVHRCQRMLVAFHAGQGRGRPVELLADLAARDAAARTSARGRPSMLLEVGAVLALDSDPRSGRRALPGRAETAELAGCSERAVSSGWARAEERGWCERTRQGRRLTFVERVELGRCNDRAEWDITPLHRGDTAARARCIPTALAVYTTLLRRVCGLLEAAQRDRDALYDASTAWADWTQRAQLRHAVTATLQAVTQPLTSVPSPTNKRTPRSASKGMSVNSCPSLGLLVSRPILIHSPVPNDGRPLRGRNTKSGASRSSTKARRPEWADWAYDVARALRAVWQWLSAVPGPQVAATLGARLGPQWTAEDLVAYVERRRRGWALLDDPAVPITYLIRVLEQTFTADDEPPYPARLHQHVAAAAQQARHAAIERDRDRLQARQTARRAQLDAQAAAAVDLDRTTTGAAANLAPWRGDQGKANVAAKQRARQQRDAELRAALAAIPADVEWPEVRQPGSGLPGGPRNGGTR